MTVWELIQDKWEELVILAGAMGGGKVAVDRNKKKLKEEISSIDQKQDFHISQLNKRVSDLEENSAILNTRVSDIDKKVDMLYAELKLNSERDKYNQEKIMLQLQSIADTQMKQGAILDEWSKNIADFYYLNPQLKKPD